MTRKQLESIIRFSSEFNDASMDIAQVNEQFGLSLTDKTSPSQAVTAYLEAKRIRLEEQSKWIRTEVELPPPNTLVWAKRSYQGKQSVYLAKRNSQELSTDPDASRNCHWAGVPFEQLIMSSDSNGGVYFGYYFSDVTVSEWRLVESPSLESEVTNGN